tara:strand:+ start:835 stop:1095 length:261 start_codon:yes stop_codon:yes gene_type:complete
MYFWKLTKNKRRFLMTKKHFIALAEALKGANASRDLIEAIMKVCRQCNSNFDREKFKQASGFYDEETMLNGGVSIYKLSKKLKELK